MKFPIKTITLSAYTETSLPETDILKDAMYINEQENI